MQVLCGVYMEVYFGFSVIWHLERFTLVSFKAGSQWEIIGWLHN
jgi:hypothetical protein